MFLADSAITSLDYWRSDTALNPRTPNAGMFLTDQPASQARRKLTLRTCVGAA
jgi:hypothetical protein